MGELVAKKTGPRTWWKHGTVYQIYPASYKDSNGDGIGDIPGIISKLDYLQDLGIDIIWISPMYDSPQIDMGYDISNYEDIYRPYGTVADAERLIEECHKRSMKLVFDLVINHTSDQHAWFKESRSSKDNPKRDWYIWRPAKYALDGTRQPPNNWRAHFDGSAWEWDEGSQEYYLHLFCPEQPDLNWENSTTRQAIYDSSMKFWLDKGIDGFRVDTVNMYSKGTALPDAVVHDPEAPYQFDASLFCNGPRMHEFLSEMHTQVLSKYDCMTVGELPHTPRTADVIRYVSATSKELDMVFQFDLVDLGQGADYKFETRPYDLVDIKRILDRFQHLIVGTDAWSTVFMENHDQSRSVSRYTDDSPATRGACAKMLAVLSATLTGTLYLYQGQEIGMVNVSEDWTAKDYKDVEALNYLAHVRAKEKAANGGKTVPDEDSPAVKEALRGIQAVGRDNARIPMLWDDSPHGGFSSGAENPAAVAEPWMRAHDDYVTLNVKQQLADPDSVLHFWRKMLKLRKSEEWMDTFVYGSFEMEDVESDKERICFTKSSDGNGKGEEQKMVFVALNFTGKELGYEVPERVKGKKTSLLVGSLGVEEGVVDGRLRAWEGRIYEVL
ncbi:alpha-glucosidase mal12 [Agyrium rufum]|nr:alpha-glucosidase mal12 [Agyrium rufum]